MSGNLVLLLFLLCPTPASLHLAEGLPPVLVYCFSIAPQGREAEIVLLVEKGQVAPALRLAQSFFHDVVSPDIQNLECRTPCRGSNTAPNTRLRWRCGAGSTAGRQRSAT